MHGCVQSFKKGADDPRKEYCLPKASGDRTSWSRMVNDAGLLARVEMYVGGSYYYTPKY